MKRLILVALAASLALPASASAQTVVMRKIISSRLPSKSPDSVGKAEWKASDWRWENPELTCSDAARQVRSISCLTKSGAAVNEARCAGEMPQRAQTLQRYDGCVTAWKADTEWSAYSSLCSEVATRTRGVRCVRSGGDSAARLMDASACTGAMPATGETRAVYDGCGHAWHVGDGWSDWSSTCSDIATHTRTVRCVRSGGDSKPLAVADESCLGAASKPVASESMGVYSSCTHRWQPTYGAWIGSCGETRTRSVSYTCMRSGIGAGDRVVDNSFCTTPMPPEMETGEPIACDKPNLIADGDLEWSYNTWSPAGRYSGDAHGGKYYGEVASDKYTVKQIYDLVIGRTYVLSVWTRARSFGCGNAVVQLQHNYPRDLARSCTTTWTKSSLTFKAIATNANVVIGGGQIQFDDVSLVEQ